jgi:hypothetical protein
VGVTIGNMLPQSFSSPHPTGVAFSNPEQYRWVNNDKNGSDEVFKQLNQPDDNGADDNSGGSIGMLSGSNNNGENPLDFLQRTALDAQLSSDKIIQIARKFRPAVEYPRTRLADSLSLVGRMIAGGLPTRVYYVSQGGYDTHTNQTGTHDRLMAELNDSVSAFCKDLQAQGNFNRVVLMTFSEFGRRVVQNGSNGTDHGAASPMFVLGGGVKPGMFGKYPSLTDLNAGDLKYNVDFRSVYATLLEKWMYAPSKNVLGRQFPFMPLV